MAEDKNTEKRVDTLETKFEMFMKSQDERFNTFMNELQQQREDIRRINERIDATNARIDSKFDAISNQLHSLTIAAVVGFGAVVVAVVGAIFAVVK